jgi:seryl-tRNA synthetase
MRKLKPANSDNLRDIASAINHMEKARDYLRSAGCSNAADYVARALKSAHGAERHARRRFWATVEGRTDASDA